MKEFYLVWDEVSENICKKHETYESACNEAKRLVENNPKKSFVVLKAEVKVKASLYLEWENATPIKTETSEVFTKHNGV